VSTLDDRRQSAREAYSDAVAGPRFEADVDPVDIYAEALDEAIETATRVDITPEMVEIVRCLDPNGMVSSIDDCRRGLVDVFRAAGFEVER